MTDQQPEGDPPPSPTVPPAPPPPYPYAGGSGTPGTAPPPPPYPSAYAGGYVPPQTDGTAIAALVLAISSFLLMLFVAVLSVIMSIVALVLARSSRRKIAASGGRLTGMGLNKAAVIVAWVHIGVWIALIAAIAVLIYLYD